MQQDNNPKHTSKSIKKLTKQKKFYILEWQKKKIQTSPPIETLGKSTKKKKKEVLQGVQFCNIHPYQFCQLCRIDQQLTEMFEVIIVDQCGHTIRYSNQGFTYFFL